MPILLLDLQQRYQNQIAPGNDLEFFRIASEADERLLESGKWHWTREKIELNVVDGLVELPADYSSIVACRLDDIPIGVRWQESEYYDEGLGELPIDGCRARIIDQGLIDGVRTYKVTLSSIEKVYALAKFANTPDDLSESDELHCPSYTALKLMMFSIIYEEANDLQKSMEYESAAMRKLKALEDSYRGIAKEIFTPSQYAKLRRRSRTNFP